jgi:hypothetical protein
MAPKSKPAKPRPKKRPAAARGARALRLATEESFPNALAALLRSKRIRVPAGLEAAPPQAYASQPPSFVESLKDLGNDELRRYAEKIAGYAARQAERARQAWEGSPLIAELRRRKLREPACPARVVGASVSLTKPLKEWSDAELVRAASEWSRMGQA